MKTIDVLMSTYNGEKYLEEQVESIIKQRNVYTVIHIRDDGSEDNTLEIISKLQNRYPNRIFLIKGSNIGYTKSFLNLLLHAMPNADYYAFSDQDDYWDERKCERAVKMIKNSNREIALYTSPLIITDKNLCEIYKTNLSNLRNELKSNFARGRLAGCTFVFTSKLKEYARRFSELDLPSENMPDYDLIVSSLAFACGKVIIDDQPMVMHRRHEASVTSGGRGLLHRIKTEKRFLLESKDVRYNLANELLKMNFPEMKVENKIFLEQVSHYKDSWKSKVLLLTNKGLTTNMLLCDLESKIKILLSNF